MPLTTEMISQLKELGVAAGPHGYELGEYSRALIKKVGIPGLWRCTAPVVFTSDGKREISGDGSDQDWIGGRFECMEGKASKGHVTECFFKRPDTLFPEKRKLQHYYNYEVEPVSGSLVAIEIDYRDPNCLSFRFRAAVYVAYLSENRNAHMVLMDERAADHNQSWRLLELGEFQKFIV